MQQPQATLFTPSRQLRLPKGACLPLLRGPISTTNNAVTTPGTQVQNLFRSNNKCLHQIHLCSSSWERAIAYLDFESATQHVPPFIHFSQCPSASPYPSVSDMIAAGEELSDLERFLQARNPAPLTSIGSMQDESREQLLNVVGSMIKMRYRNSVTSLTPDKTFRSSDDDSVVATANVPSQFGIFTPGWVRCCPAHHLDKRSPKNSGFTDFLLCSELNEHVIERRQTQKAGFEAKSPWVYPTQQIIDLMNGRSTIVSANGQFAPRNLTTPILLLIKQLWGELTFLGPNLAFFTNGDVCVMMYQILQDEPDGQENPNTLVVSPALKWTDPRLRVAFTGFCFAALDEGKWASAGGKTLRDILFPVEDCTLIRGLYNHDSDDDEGDPDETTNNDAVTGGTHVTFNLPSGDGDEGNDNE
ncbi:hypothetical protein FISHEDRAFT_75106 [Fistulina hepatica ATCC 64428]|uniref:Uncharacterized protein n=1 Tax=Fistulina hepatica ATCC 64428 TaxID=1128425 RepID=A0A0D7A7K3_9AGAR|nr:hypothetical protein FISHEDRAFT_78125 [Fistulina hepatica ATCC 64428]KIY46987.1 hypothetical protein FISHEDRAFT_75106 [Fistulina hepatica ATCC 64428]